MNHIHLNSTPSTQDYILENFKHPKEDILVSTDIQTQGKGQYDRSWKHVEGALTFSFTLTPNKIITLSSLEIPVLLKQYFSINFSKDILLKWPNDLMTSDGYKFGGILINRHGYDDLVIGIGLNLWPIDKDPDFLFKAAGLFDNQLDFNTKSLSLDIYQYILKHRMTSTEIISEWNQACIHFNQEVKIQESSQTHTGIFKGIGDNGQALLAQADKVQEIYTGSLFF